MSHERKFDQLYKELNSHLPPAEVSHGTSNAQLLSPGRGFMRDFDLTMQQQVGCPAGCQFCYVAKGFRLAPADVQRNWGFDVRTKAGAERQLRTHLLRGDLADKTIYWSGVTDPYASPPAMTRIFWQAFCNALPHQRPRRIVVQTRFRPDRDVDLMAEYCRSTRPSDLGPAVVVSYSVGTDRDDLIQAWERATPGFESRMKVLAALCDAGIFTVATLSPFALWHDLTAAMKRMSQIGVPYLTVLFFKDRTGATTTPPQFLQHLRTNYPQLLDPDWQAERVEEIRCVFGSRVLIGQPGFASLARPHDFLNGLERQEFPPPMPPAFQNSMNNFDITRRGTAES